jgi:hypothetical protein
MAKYEDIKRNLESVRTNKIGENFVSIRNLAAHFNYTADEVRPVVQDLIAEGKMKFRKPFVNPNQKTYDAEYLEVIKQRKIQRKNNSWLYR